ncbi:MAG: ABC transporter ATP-binding protein [Ekhidna sp.]
MSLKVENITKKFGDNTILEGVSLEVKKGDIFSLSGESGCGKSTLLRIIAGLEKADTGNVYFESDDITHLTPENRNFGFVFQNLALFPHLNVKENIFYAIKSTEKSKKRLDQLLGMTGLDGLDRRYPHELSGGQQQRVALARALSINPKMLILDEPFSSLDELLKARIREEIFDLLRSLEITTILVSHQSTDAFLIADQLAIMKEGKVLQEGTPTEVYQNPISPYVSDFFGASVIMDGKKINDEVATPFGNLHFPDSPEGSFKVFLRPENIVISSEHNYNLKGMVSKKDFKGPHDVLSIKSESSNSYISLETERSELDVGDLIFLSVPEEKIKIFN